MAPRVETSKVWEGTWQEVSVEVATLPPSQRVRLELLPCAGDAAARPPNRAMLDALREVEVLQRGMDPQPGDDSVALIREARGGTLPRVGRPCG